MAERAWWVTAIQWSFWGVFMTLVMGFRARLELKKRVRDLALFNLAIDSKLRACDLTRLKVEDIMHRGRDRQAAKARRCARLIEV